MGRACCSRREHAAWRARCATICPSGSRSRCSALPAWIRRVPLAQLRRDERLRLLELLERGALPWTGHEGYKKAEVTGGGVSLAEIDPRTMQSRRHPGLFLCGEMLDAFGPIGGYNFVWAWVTGRAAGLGAARLVTASS